MRATPPRLVLLLVPLLVACGAAEPAPRLPPDAARTTAAVADVTSFVRHRWHLPLEVRVRFSQAAEDALAGGPAETAGARLHLEDDLVAEQVGKVEEAIGRAAFDVLALTVVVDPERDEADVEYDPRTAGLAIELPQPADGRAVHPVAVDDLLEAIARRFDWNRLGPWWKGEVVSELAAALERDLAKVAAIEAELDVQCRRLELLSGVVIARAEVTEQEPTLVPSEAQCAREAQVRVTYALQRLLNTLGRWRTAADDQGFPYLAEARLVRARAALIHEAYLGWILDILVGHRPLLAVWDGRWWHRNPLYPVLDAQASIVVHVQVDGADGGPLGGPPRSASVPAGSVRALLRLRCDGDLTGAYSDAEDQAEGLSPASFTRSPMRPLAEAALERLPASRELVLRRGVAAFTAWKELWDARLKNGFDFPLYHVVAGVSTFLGDTRYEPTDPALEGDRLEALTTKLRPGDVLLVREEGFLSNAFLPGFWPHALIWLGPPEAWGGLKLADGTLLRDDLAGERALARWRTLDGHPPRVLEAISEGVVFSSVEHALAKDFVAVLRPTVPEAEVAEALRRALPFVGRPYDFDFDFATDDRVVCTELVYRAYDPVLNFRVQADGKPDLEPRIPGLVNVLGRQTMPANEVARYALYMADHGDPEPARAYPGRRLEIVAVVERDAAGEAQVLEGAAAVTALRESVDR